MFYGASNICEEFFHSGGRASPLDNKRVRLFLELAHFHHPLVLSANIRHLDESESYLPLCLCARARHFSCHRSPILLAYETIYYDWSGRSWHLLIELTLYSIGSLWSSRMARHTYVKLAHSGVLLVISDASGRHWVAYARTYSLFLFTNATTK